MTSANFHREPLSPFLRWAGSKRKLLPILTRFWKPHFRRYIEPFMGSACLYFALQPREAILSDINPDLVLTFRTLKYQPQTVARALQEIAPGRESYYELRNRDPQELAPAERAARFIFLNRFCFNGLYRTNARGQFNVPFSGQRVGTLPSVSQLSALSRALKPAELLTGDFESVLGDVGPGDFVYMDPPYATTGRRNRGEYGPGTFSLKDLPRLRTALTMIHRRGGKFLLSYAGSPEAERWAAPWRYDRVTVQRNISGFAKHRKLATEILVTNIAGAEDERRVD